MMNDELVSVHELLKQRQNLPCQQADMFTGCFKRYSNEFSMMYIQRREKSQDTGISNEKTMNIEKQTTNKGQFNYDKWVFLIPTLFVFSIWLVYWIEIKYDINFNRNGIFPRTISGLKGIVFSPFIHSGTKHLFNNSSPLFVLIASLLYFYRKISFKILVFGTLLTGLLTWLIARPAYHIGASSIIYMLVSFVFFSGIFRKYYRLIALSLVIVFLYGSMIWYVLPIKEGISWEGHLSGFIVGFAFAIYYKNTGPQAQKYEYTVTEFDTYFDEDGNFVPPIPDTTEEESSTSTTYSNIVFKSNETK